MIITLCPFNTFSCAETKKGWQEGTNVMEALAQRHGKYHFLFRYFSRFNG